MGLPTSSTTGISSSSEASNSNLDGRLFYYEKPNGDIGTFNREQLEALTISQLKKIILQHNLVSSTNKNKGALVYHILKSSKSREKSPSEMVKNHFATQTAFNFSPSESGQDSETKKATRREERFEQLGKLSLYDYYKLFNGVDTIDRTRGEVNDFPGHLTHEGVMIANLVTMAVRQAWAISEEIVWETSNLETAHEVARDRSGKINGSNTFTDFVLKLSKICMKKARIAKE